MPPKVLIIMLLGIMTVGLKGDTSIARSLNNDS